MVQLKDLVERFLCDFADALTLPPLTKGTAFEIALLYPLHVGNDDQRGTQELVLGRPVKVDRLQAFFQLLPLLDNLLEFIVVVF